MLFDASIKSIKFKTKLNGNSEKVPRGNVEKNPYGLWNRSWIGVSENSPDHQINGMDYLLHKGSASKLIKYELSNGNIRI